MKDFTLKFLGKDSGFGKMNNSAYYEDNEKFILIDCGYTVFQQLREKINLKKYQNIYVIITHLHNDHAGSLSQFILYMWFVYNKKITILSKCNEIKRYLDITGVPPESYYLQDEYENLEFIKTSHSPYIDSYGFQIVLNDKKIIYTSDTDSIEPFLEYLKTANELYIDVSKNGGIHITIDDIIETIDKYLKQGLYIKLMHIDDREYVENAIKNKLSLNEQNLEKLDF